MKVALAFLFLLSLTRALEASESYVALADRTLAAFECAKYAEMADDAGQSDKLFTIAVQDGTSVLRAIHNGDLKDDTLKDEPEWFVVMATTYKQSDDFILGRLFERSSRTAGEIFKGEFPATLDQYRNRAEQAFNLKNCKLLF